MNEKFEFLILFAPTVVKCYDSYNELYIGKLCGLNQTKESYEPSDKSLVYNSFIPTKN